MTTICDDADLSAGRRRVLLGIAAFGTTLALPTELLAARHDDPRYLQFYNLHTDESLKVTYWDRGRYIDTALAEINTLLRDFRTGEVHTIDARLLDFLHTVQRAFDSKDIFEIISGYRSAKTNATLRARSKGVAKRSFHMKGMAIDVRLRGRDLALLRNVATRLQRGGVGFYRKSNFVHLDVGRVRAWG